MSVYKKYKAKGSGTIVTAYPHRGAPVMIIKYENQKYSIPQELFDTLFDAVEEEPKVEIQEEEQSWCYVYSSNPELVPATFMAEASGNLDETTVRLMAMGRDNRLMDLINETYQSIDKETARKMASKMLNNFLVKFKGLKRNMQTQAHEARSNRCKKYAPKPLSNGEFPDRVQFPVTVNDEWCGEFKPKDDKVLLGKKEIMTSLGWLQTLLEFTTDSYGMNNSQREDASKLVMRIRDVLEEGVKNNE